MRLVIAFIGSAAIACIAQCAIGFGAGMETNADDTSLAAVSATMLSVHPPSAITAYGAFSRNAAWDEQGDRGQSAAQAPEVDPDILAGVEDQAPVRSLDENYYEFRAYNYLLVRAHNAPSASLAAKARRDLTFAHLFEEPNKYRGQLVHIEGTLRRLRRFDPVRAAQKEGVKDLYEGWVFAEPYFNNPFCIVASAIGPGLAVGEQLHQRVSFDGYFFKRFRYKAGDTLRDAPILIGRNIEAGPALSADEEPPWSFSRQLRHMVSRSAGTRD